MWPSFVNLTALPEIFKIVCISLFSSPMAHNGKSGANITDTDSLLMAAIGLMKLITYLLENSMKIECFNLQFKATILKFGKI
ncbi:Os03g0701750 [Oryza sativa Japonica Group]|uniref:Os03g0701750 protein n=1 Tax=Oryza sativa subsp. japonica TaxID=39947 RepID=A0A0P0W2J1_ORYSJ|nr:hypothetical protein EE612_019891 [Oryza sativa]BAS85938.1 Os03g0701750 [Oryza sativa Japonica Group]